MKIIETLKTFLSRSPPRGFSFDRVVSVEPTGLTEDVYDLTSANHEFVANGILIHNCHAAAWTISQSTDRSANGHGPIWQGWMTKVGLDPRRFDPTDNAEMLTGPARVALEHANDKRYGPRAPEDEVDALEQDPHPVSGGNYQILVDGRIIKGVLNGKKFIGRTDAGRTLVWTFKDLKSQRFYKINK